VEKAITESAQSGAALAAREGWLVARTRFFVEFRCAADEHLLLPRRDTAKGGFLILGIEPGSVPEFGFTPRVPLLGGATERTEIDMKLGNMLFEAKLTEGDFQIQRVALVEGYRDLRDVFGCPHLPRLGRKYVSYQLVRNVLAAQALSLDFCTLLDVRRPDLLEDSYDIVRCIRFAGLRAKCKVLTWQELAVCLPAALQRFLSVKYGIVLVS